ncbi:MAG TPA: tetratricopeptide repeat protein, partial [Tenuifilaceae bacterium]|nr:tetratricopeptide repeat protein [Tenuifilaceae bacterium]
MAKNNKNAQPDTVESIDNALSQTERFIEQNQKSLTIIIVAILVIISLYFGYKRFYLVPKEDEARSQIFQAEYYF